MLILCDENQQMPYNNPLRVLESLRIRTRIDKELLSIVLQLSMTN